MKGRAGRAKGEAVTAERRSGELLPRKTRVRAALRTVQETVKKFGFEFDADHPLRIDQINKLVDSVPEDVTGFVEIHHIYFTQLANTILDATNENLPLAQIVLFLFFDHLNEKITTEQFLNTLAETGESKAVTDKILWSLAKWLEGAANLNLKHRPSEADDTSRLRMRDDFNIAAREAKAERTAAGRLANYEFLAGTVDLENPALAVAEQRRRANGLLTAYRRVQEVRRDFTDSNIQLTAARRIQKGAYREGQRVKRPPAPRGRPRKLAT